MAEYSTLKSVDSCSVYFDECDRKEALGQPHFGICDYVVLVLIYVLWVISLPLTWWCTFKIIPQFQRVIIFRLGRLQSLKGPGLIFVIPCVDRWKIIDMRMRAFKVPPQEILTVDRALYKVGADVQYRISDPLAANTLIQDLDYTLRVSAHAALSSLLCCEKLNFIQTEKRYLETQLQVNMNKSVSDWGIEIARFELTHSFVSKGPGGSYVSEESNEAGGGAAILDLFKSLTSSSSSFHMPGMMPTPSLLSNQNSLLAPPSSQPNQKSLLTPDELFCIVKGILSDELCKQVNALYEFHVTEDYETKIWVIDLKHSPGCVKSGPAEVPVDVRFALNKSVAQQLFYGQLSATEAYMNGSLVVDGSLQTAKKLEYLVRKMKDND